MPQEKGGVSVHRLAKGLELHYETAWLMLDNREEALADRDRRSSFQGLV